MPGNHDWYDGLQRVHVRHCAAPSRCRRRRAAPAEPRPGCARLLWHRPRRDRRRSASPRHAQLRSAPAQQAASSPGPYWAIDAGPVRIVGIDTGHHWARSTATRAAWLRGSPRAREPKILVTGKPIYVDGEHHPARSRAAARRRHRPRPGAPTTWRRSAATSTTTSATGRRRTAARSSTSSRAAAARSCTPRTRSREIALDGVERGRRSAAIRCAATRCRFYSRLYDAQARPACREARDPTRQAAAYMAERLGIDPTAPRSAWRQPERSARRAARGSIPLARPRGAAVPAARSPSPSTGTSRRCSRASCASRPRQRELRMRCLGATGCAGRRTNPPVEDEFTIGW